MKKFLSLLTVGALLASASGINAAYLQRGRAAAGRATSSVAQRAGRAWQGSRAQQAVQAGRAGSAAQQAKLQAFARPFLAEVGTALSAGNYQAIPGIVNKYRAQSAAAGAAAAVIAATVGALARAAIRALTSTGPQPSAPVYILADVNSVYDAINNEKYGEVVVLVTSGNFSADQIEDFSGKLMGRLQQSTTAQRTQIRQALRAIQQPAWQAGGVRSKRGKPMMGLTRQQAFTELVRAKLSEKLTAAEQELVLDAMVTGYTLQGALEQVTRGAKRLIGKGATWVSSEEVADPLLP